MMPYYYLIKFWGISGSSHINIRQLPVLIVAKKSAKLITKRAIFIFYHLL